jgi:hypothetical protein
LERKITKKDDATKNSFITNGAETPPKVRYRHQQFFFLFFRSNFLTSDDHSFRKPILVTALTSLYTRSLSNNPAKPISL